MSDEDFMYPIMPGAIYATPARDADETVLMILEGQRKELAAYLRKRSKDERGYFSMTVDMALELAKLLEPQ